MLAAITLAACVAVAPPGAEPNEVLETLSCIEREPVVGVFTPNPSLFESHPSTRPIPAGFHVESRRRGALLIAGGVVTFVGLGLLVTSALMSREPHSGCASKNGELCIDIYDIDAKVFLAFMGVAVTATGTGLFLGGLPKHDVLVRNDVPTPRAHGVAIGLRF